MAGNQKFGSAYFHWSEFDALPQRLRNIIAHAPSSYSVTNLLAGWRRSGDLDSCARVLIEKIFDDRDHLIARDWGEDHPMIGARPKGWRA